MPKVDLKKRLYGWRVRAGLIGVILVVILAKPDLLSLLRGLAVCILGLLLRMWAAGHLRKQKELTISGPYMYTRNPLYLGNLIIGFGIVIASRSLWGLCIFMAYFLLFYPLVIHTEKERMKTLFPVEYEKYRKKTPLFLPSMRPFSTLNKNRFSWKTFRENKEWRAIFGTAFFWLILLAKFIFL
jgi:protein-S-isoprenylcysteine O-methyltransferase Ste14